MVFFKSVTFLVLVALSVSLCQVSQGGGHVSQGGAHVHQGGPHENQGGRVRRQVSQTGQSQDAPPEWTTCDVTATPVVSCHDCHTRLICKPVGGLLINCDNPYKPYCNNGICSPFPSAGCA